MTFLKHKESNVVYKGLQLTADLTELRQVADEAGIPINLSHNPNVATQRTVQWQHAGRAHLAYFNIGDWVLQEVGSTAKLVISDDDKVADYDLVDSVEPTDVSLEFNTKPNELALGEDGFLKNGTRISGEFATVASDGILEIAIIPTIPGVRVVGPSKEGTFSASITDDQDLGMHFVLTALEDGADISEVLKGYNVKMVVGNNSSQTNFKFVVGDDGKVTVNSLHLADYIIVDSFQDQSTVQNGTRVSFLRDANLMFSDLSDTMHYIQIDATNVDYNKTLTVKSSVLITRANVLV